MAAVEVNMANAIVDDDIVVVSYANLEVDPVLLVVRQVDRFAAFASLHVDLIKEREVQVAKHARDLAQNFPLQLGEIIRICCGLQPIEVGLVFLWSVEMESPELGQTGSAQFSNKLVLRIGIGLALQPRLQGLDILETRGHCANLCKDLSHLALELGSIQRKRNAGGETAG